ncbi:MAG: nucleoside-diphosphate sugar epimerase/dehydratase, partial [Anaerolineae bacterium]
MKRKADAVFALLLLFNDLATVALAFYLAYRLRQTIAVPPPVNIAPFADYVGMMMIQIVTMPLLFFFSRLYDVKRSMPRLDEFYRIFAATSIGTIVTIALTTFLFKNSSLELDFPRVMVIYAWLLTVILVTASRSLWVVVRNLLRRRGLWTDRLLIVGTGEVGRMILQKIRQMPRLGYRVVGFVDGDADLGQEIMGLPVLGSVDDIPE